MTKILKNLKKLRLLTHLSKNHFIYIFLIVVFSLFFVPLTDPDFGWHYRCGGLLLEANPCITNTFTYYLEGYRWANPTFLYDASLYIGNSTFGFAFNPYFYAFLMVLFSGYLIKTTKIAKELFALFFIIAVLLSQTVFAMGIRSQIVSVVLVLVTIRFLKSGSLRRLYFLPLIFLFWVNTHAGFFIGLVIFFIFIISLLITKIFGSYIKNIGLVLGNIYSVKYILICLVVLVIAGLMALFNPFGFRVYEEVIRHIQTPMHLLIAEWTRPNLYQICLMLALYFVYLLVSFKQKKFNLFGVLILTLFLFLAISAKRNLAFFYLSYIIFIEDFGQHLALSRVLLYVLASYLLFFAPFRFLDAINNSNYEGYCNSPGVKYPCDLLKNYEFENGARIYNRYEWGGYLIYKLPNQKIFVDGRMPAWINNAKNESPYTTYLNILQTREGWDKELKDLDTNYILISPHTFMDLELVPDPQKYGYTEEYRDEVAVLYKRVSL